MSKQQPAYLTVEQLRKSGAKVRVLHTRIHSKTGKPMPRKDIPKGEFNGKGGGTRVEISLPDGTELAGEANCSKRESFSYRQGLRVALGRALAQYQESVEPGEDKVVLKVTPNSFAAIPA